MRLASYRRKEGRTATAAPRSAWVVEDGTLVDIRRAVEWWCESYSTRAGGGHVRGFLRKHGALFQDLSELVWRGEVSDLWKAMRQVYDDWSEAVRHGNESALACTIDSDTVNLCLPFRPRSFRDFYAFEQHVATCRRKRGLDMVPEWYEFPVFYFSNTTSFRGPNEPVWAPPGCQELDYELEVACVIGKPGRNIAAKEADEYILGYAILNDWSARDVQRQEMKVGLGPAKGKDFATSFGPYLVTADHLDDVAVSGAHGRRHRLTMIASVNGRTISSGNLADIHFTFAQMIERASADVDLMPGDVIGSGTVGTGCILELGTQVHSWLQPGDVVELTVDKLGVLQTPIVERPNWR
jgi:fumarylacetoacetate (FAA) hydrolase